MRKIFTIFLLVSMMCVSICGCSSASARQETLLTIEEKTEVDALETAITATDANQTIADSPEFPDTIKEVIHAEGQYANANTDYFKNLTPFEPCVEAAARLLSGERVLNEPSVVFQSGGVQGSGVYLELYSSYYGYTYLCYSSYPELYGG